eukprot:scaffold823_cov397-Prasinococcus_capsulatus_cf.AAC.11
MNGRISREARPPPARCVDDERGRRLSGLRSVTTMRRERVRVPRLRGPAVASPARVPSRSYRRGPADHA